MKLGLPDCCLLAHIVPPLIHSGQSLSHGISLALGWTVVSQVTPNHIDTHGHTLVTVQVEQELSVVLDHLLQVFNAGWNSLVQAVTQLSVSVLQPLLQPPEVSLQLSPVLPPAE